MSERRSFTRLLAALAGIEPFVDRRGAGRRLAAHLAKEVSLPDSAT